MRIRRVESLKFINLGDILLLLNNEVPCRVTLYWEVNKDSLTAAISQDESETASSFDHHSEINDPELRELPSMSTIPLEHILDGCYEDRDPSELYPFNQYYFGYFVILNSLK